MLLPTVEVFRRLSHKIGKTESAVLKLSGFSSVEVLTWPLVSVSYAYAKISVSVKLLFLSLAVFRVPQGLAFSLGS